MGTFLLSIASAEMLSWLGFVVLAAALIGEAGIWLIPKKWESLHAELAFALAVIAAAGYAVERVGDEAITVAQIAAINGRMNRVIMPEQHKKLVALLKDAPKGKVIVNSASMDAEASQFGDQILSVLKDAGFEAVAPSFEERAMSFNRPGAFFWLKNRDHQPAHALPIWKAFKQTGFTFTGAQEPSVPDEQTLEIAISSHP